ncbi:MAG TPA: hypothetical protein VF867_17290 [Arthrobacter sp.]
MKQLIPITVLAAALLLTGCSAPDATPPSADVTTPVIPARAPGALSGDRVMPATNTVKAGDGLKVSGSGWAPGSTVKLGGQKTPPRPAEGTVGQTPEATAPGTLGQDVTVKVGDDGRYEGTFTIPTDAAPQSFLVVAKGSDGTTGGALVTIG